MAGASRAQTAMKFLRAVRASSACLRNAVSLREGMSSSDEGGGGMLMKSNVESGKR